MQPIGGTPAPLSWIAETVLGAIGALGGAATALQLCGRCFLSLRDVVAALGELEQRGFVERVGRGWRATGPRAAGEPLSGVMWFRNDAADAASSTPAACRGVLPCAAIRGRVGLAGPRYPIGRDELSGAPGWRRWLTRRPC